MTHVTASYANSTDLVF